MEIFKIIKEYPMYSVSTEGRIMKNASHKIMTPTKTSKGYMQINLFTKDGRRKKELVHRLVAITFIPNDKKLPEVNHIDQVRHNNCVSNLEWVSHEENVAKSSLPKKIRVKHLASGEVIEFVSMQEACARLSLTASNVSACLHNYRQRTHRGYIFEFI